MRQKVTGPRLSEAVKTVESITWIVGGPDRRQLEPRAILAAGSRPAQATCRLVQLNRHPIFSNGALGKRARRVGFKIEQRAKL